MKHDRDAQPTRDEDLTAALESAADEVFGPGSFIGDAMGHGLVAHGLAMGLREVAPTAKLRRALIRRSKRMRMIAAVTKRPFDRARADYAALLPQRLGRSRLR